MELGLFDNNKRPQDAHEALCMLFDACEAVDWRMLLALPLPAHERAALDRNAGMNADRCSTTFWRAFGGVTLSTVICHACRTVTSRYDQWHHVSLSLPAESCTIEHLIGNFFRAAVD